MSDAPKPNRKLLPGQMQSAEFQRQDMIVRPEAGTTIEEMLNPAYWVHVARGFKVFDRIEVRPVDGGWWAELLVRVVEPFTMVTQVLRLVKLETAGGTLAADITAPDGYEFKHRGPKGWAVVRLSDGAELKAAESSKESAAAWLAGHLRKVAVAA